MLTTVCMWYVWRLWVNVNYSAWYIHVRYYVWYVSMWANVKTSGTFGCEV